MKKRKVKKLETTPRTGKTKRLQELRKKIAKIYPERDMAESDFRPFGGKDYFLP